MWRRIAFWVCIVALVMFGMVGIYTEAFLITPWDYGPIDWHRTHPAAIVVGYTLASGLLFLWACCAVLLCGATGYSRLASGRLRRTFFRAYAAGTMALLVWLAAFVASVGFLRLWGLEEDSVVYYRSGWFMCVLFPGLIGPPLLLWLLTALPLFGSMAVRCRGACFALLSPDLRGKPGD